MFVYVPKAFLAAVPAQESRLPVTPDTLKQHCLGSAELWVLKRRANRPGPPERHLPAVAKAG